VRQDRPQQQGHDASSGTNSAAAAAEAGMLGPAGQALLVCSSTAAVHSGYCGVLLAEKAHLAPKCHSQSRRESQPSICMHAAVCATTGDSAVTRWLHAVSASHPRSSSIVGCCDAVEAGRAAAAVCAAPPNHLHHQLPDMLPGTVGSHTCWWAAVEVLLQQGCRVIVPLVYQL
jgi:hypothetical protein